MFFNPTGKVIDIVEHVAAIQVIDIVEQLMLQFK